MYMSNSIEEERCGRMIVAENLLALLPIVIVIVIVIVKLIRIINMTNNNMAVNWCTNHHTITYVRCVCVYKLPSKKDPMRANNFPKQEYSYDL